MVAQLGDEEILSSDFCRGLVSDDENSQAATNDAFEVLHFIARKRLAAGKLMVVDATNVQPESRKPLVQLAREFHCLPVAIVLDLPERVAHDRNKTRPDRDFGPHVIRQQAQQLHRSLRGLEREGFRQPPFCGGWAGEPPQSGGLMEEKCLSARRAAR